MTAKEIENLCKKKEQELLDKYFGNLVSEAAIEKPETIGNYTKGLPLEIVKEYYHYLEELWEDINPDKSITLKQLLDKKGLCITMTDDDREDIQCAYEDATRRTLWERITGTNHKDVAYYKGLLLEYTRELLSYLRCDFMEDVERI